MRKTSEYESHYLATSIYENALEIVIRSDYSTCEESFLSRDLITGTNICEKILNQKISARWSFTNV